MEGEIVLKGFGPLGVGLVLIRLGFAGWKYRREDRINIIEAAILKAVDGNPQPFGRWDRMWAYIQPVFMLIVGSLMVLAGIAILSLLGE